MSKRFRECSLDQPFLLPPSLQDWLPEDHLARFPAEVADTLELSEIYAPVTGTRMRPGVGIHLLVVPERSRPTTQHSRASALAVAMRERLRAPVNRKLYAMRQASVEPVLGQTKELRRFRRF